MLKTKKPGYYTDRDGTRYIREDVAKRFYAPNKRMQFSQKICVFSCIFIVAIWLGNFVLAWFDKPQIPEAISVGFTIFGGFVTGGYFTLSGVRDCSLNKLRANSNGDENVG